jgi:taurine dioxygenase
MLDFFLWTVFSLFWMAEVTSGLRVLPFETGFGAKIVDVNMEQISGRDFDFIHAALLAYKVLIVGSQINLTVDGQRQFTSRFGSLHVHLDNTSHYPGYNDINVVSNIKGIGGVPIGLSGPRVEKFHSDLSW